MRIRTEGKVVAIKYFLTPLAAGQAGVAPDLLETRPAKDQVPEARSCEYHGAAAQKVASEIEYLHAVADVAFEVLPEVRVVPEGCVDFAAEEALRTEGPVLVSFRRAVAPASLPPDDLSSVGAPTVV